MKGMAQYDSPPETNRRMTQHKMTLNISVLLSVAI